ncbi:hypothetical protein AAG906_033022 [Vitis piasezkii]|uniref:uncharacterized protein LOC117919373 n=1 Tax=Vitis riparia TaxID=96939 RepID=UPI00155B189D|nr:uncharacterized protein LOC117919373 [Vitis riparia]
MLIKSRAALSISFLSNSTVLVGFCRPRRRPRRRKGGTIRLGNRRRGFSIAARPVVQWGVVVVRPLRMLKRVIVEMVSSGRLLEAYCWSLPFLRPPLFPMI